MTTTQYCAFPGSSPLCFLHIPKSGGSSISSVLDSYFDVDQIAPARTQHDFEGLRKLADRPYGLYRGHILGSQLDLLPKGTRVFTVMRKPAELAVSLYYHVRRETPEVYQLSRKPPPGQLWSSRDGSDIARMSAQANALCRDASLLDILSADSPIARFAFRDHLLKSLGATLTQYINSSHFHGDDPEFIALRQCQTTLARTALDETFLIADYDNMELSLLLLAAESGWPAPPPLPRTNAFGDPTSRTASDANITKAVRRMSPFDFHLWDHASAKMRGNAERLDQLTGGAPDKRKAVDELSRDLFFSKSKRIHDLDLSAERAWGGRGWDFRKYDGFGSAYREMADGRTASLWVRLDPGDYLVRCEIMNASSEDVLESLSVTVDGRPLHRSALRRVGGAVHLEWQLAAETVARMTGNMEFTFGKPEKLRDEVLWISRLACTRATQDLGSPFTAWLRRWLMPA